MLDRKFGKLPSRTKKSIEALTIALLDLITIPVPGGCANDHLKAWLKDL